MGFRVVSSFIGFCCGERVYEWGRVAGTFCVLGFGEGSVVRGMRSLLVIGKLLWFLVWKGNGFWFCFWGW